MNIHHLLQRITINRWLATETNGGDTQSRNLHKFLVQVSWLCVTIISANNLTQSDSYVRNTLDHAEQTDRPTHQHKTQFTVQWQSNSDTDPWTPKAFLTEQTVHAIRYKQWRPKAPPVTQNASQKSLGVKNNEVMGDKIYPFTKFRQSGMKVTYVTTRPPSPPVWCFSSWKAPEDRCYQRRDF